MSSYLQRSTNDYLATEIMTASPHKLRLMLIEAGLRFAERARYCWRLQQHDAATEALIRCQDIVAELLAGLGDRQSEIVRRIAGIYLFVNRTFTAALLQRSEAKLDEAISVLQIERDTWRQLCDKLAAEEGAPMELGGHKAIAAPHMPLSHKVLDDAAPQERFSIQG